MILKDRLNRRSFIFVCLYEEKQVFENTEKSKKALTFSYICDIILASTINRLFRKIF